LSRNAVSTPHHLSAEAGRLVLDGGGNAVDAAIAAVAAQGVVAPETCGVGGDLFALIQRPGWETPRALNSSGRAGSIADPETLRSAGYDSVPGDHPLTVTIPGCVDGLATLAEDLGALSLADALAPAIDLAREGFPSSTEQASAFSRQAAIYRHSPAVSSFYPGGEPVKPGDTVVRSDLASTLETVASEGRDGFYRGRAGEDIVEASIPSEWKWPDSPPGRPRPTPRATWAPGPSLCSRCSTLRMTLTIPCGGICWSRPTGPSPGKGTTS
jgi:gamma-glutamyltranspeptidase/glutathione hydrolase